MHGRTRSCKRQGCAMVGKPATVAQSTSFNRLQRRFRVPNAIDTPGKIELADRPDQKLDKLGASFIVAPVSNPYDVALLFNITHWPVQVDVSRFVPGKCPSRPSALHVYLAQHLAKGEHAVISVEIETSQF